MASSQEPLLVPRPPASPCLLMGPAASITNNLGLSGPKNPFCPFQQCLSRFIYRLSSFWGALSVPPGLAPVHFLSDTGLSLLTKKNTEAPEQVPQSRPSEFQLIARKAGGSQLALTYHGWHNQHLTGWLRALNEICK